MSLCRRTTLCFEMTRKHAFIFFNLVLITIIFCCYYYFVTCKDSWKIGINLAKKQKFFTPEVKFDLLSSSNINYSTQNVKYFTENMKNLAVNDTSYIGVLQIQFSKLLEDSRNLYHSKNAEKYVIPKETLDSNSVFYGNIYKDTYGLPLSDFGFSSFERFETDWTKLFPTLMYSLKQYRSQNPSKNPDSFTRANSIVVLEKKETYTTGETLIARIQARDRLDQKKTYGGDYFRARLIRRGENDEVIDGIPCKIYDHLNGTYSVRVPLLIPGIMTLEVKLVLSVEGINDFIDFTSSQSFNGVFYKVNLLSGETVECNFDMDRYIKYENSPLCDYSNPRNRETWFCIKPKSGICSPFSSMNAKKHLDQPPYKFLRSAQKTYGGNADISGSGITINITTLDNNHKPNQETFSNHDLPTGYLQQKHWRLLDRENIFSALDSYRKCFENKLVFMTGDSTIRQVFLIAANSFKLDTVLSDKSNVWQQPRMGKSKDKASNITIHYRAHGLPFRNFHGGPYTRPYITDLIEGVSGGEDVYIILNIAVHLLEYDASFYVHRLLGIRDAIYRHLKKFPGTKFIVKGLNVAEMPEEWLIRRLELIQRQMFEGIDNLLFFNLWDLTTIWPLGDDVHPSNDVMEQEAIAMFNYVCEWKFHD